MPTAPGRLLAIIASIAAQTWLVESGSRSTSSLSDRYGNGVDTLNCAICPYKHKEEEITPFINEDAVRRGRAGLVSDVERGRQRRHSYVVRRARGRADRCLSHARAERMHYG